MEALNNRPISRAAGPKSFSDRELDEIFELHWRPLIAALKCKTAEKNAIGFALSIAR
jgi:hypothetical protein